MTVRLATQDEPQPHAEKDNGRGIQGGVDVGEIGYRRITRPISRRESSSFGSLTGHL